MIIPRNFTGLQVKVVNLSPRLKHWSGMLAFLEKQKDRHSIGRLQHKVKGCVLFLDGVEDGLLI